jgi:hypothetical protein
MKCALERTFCCEDVNRIKLSSEDCIQDYKVSAFCPSSRIHKRANTTFQKLELSLVQVEGLGGKYRVYGR